MGTKTQYDLIHKSLLEMISYINMVGVFSSLWGFLWGYVFHVIGYITRHIFRLVEKKDEKNQEIDRIDFHGETKTKTKTKTETKTEEEEEESKFCDNNNNNNSISSSAKKYEVFGLKDINGFVEEPKAMSFTVRELYLGSEETLETAMVVGSEDDEVFEEEEEEYWKTKFEFFSEKKAPSFDVDEAEDFETVIEKELVLESEDFITEIGDFTESDFLCKSDLVLENHSLPCEEELFHGNGYDFPESDFLHKKELFSEDVDSALENRSLPCEEAEKTPSVEGEFGDHEEHIPENSDFPESGFLHKKELFLEDVGSDLENHSLPCCEEGERSPSVEGEFGDREELIPENSHDFPESDFLRKKDLFAEDGDSASEAKTSSVEGELGDREELISENSDDFREIVFLHKNDLFLEAKISSVEGESGDQEKPIPENSRDFRESDFLHKKDLFSASENKPLPSEDPKIVLIPLQNIPNIIDYSSTTSENIEEKAEIVLQNNSDSEDEYIVIEPKTSSAEFCGEKHKPDYDKTDFEFEHDDVIEQLKLELRTARTGGLPTILEEESDADENAESPVEPKLRPMKIEFKFGYKERLEEAQKVYKIYAERMRKLDILNNQTMHALGFLQLKEKSGPTTPKQKPTTAMSFLLLPLKGQRLNDKSSGLKYDAKLQNDFELVYVGQVCLSWEILRWQHGIVRDYSLQNDNDTNQPRRRYCHVASEFQLFQVLAQRFVEDESFRGPRVQNYVKNRCVLSSLMQVPMIRDDSVKGKQCVMEGNEECVSCEILDKIVVDSMFTFWEFIRKDEKSVDSKVSQQSVTEPGDSRLLMDIRKEFQKKERKVKEIQRSGNCVVKKLQKNQGIQVQQHVLLLAQIELRLVSRVLGMSRLTRDKLVWCQQKLNQISFANKKLHLETSFLLFPC